MRTLLSLIGIWTIACSVFAEDPLSIIATTKGDLRIGHIVSLRLEITNRLDVPLVLLEMKPQQPCEDPESLIRGMYGDVRYEEDSDSYVHDSLVQKSSMIPVLEGYIGPGKSLWLNLSYRPYADQEVLEITYLLPGDQSIYIKDGTDGSITRFTRDGKDFQEVIIPKMSEQERKTMEARIRFTGITGTAGPYCYCEVLRENTDWLPSSLCKEWDTGKTVLFRVGENQKGIDPEPLSADWKFLDEFPVEYGDGMYTHGEFVRISPEEASRFVRLIRGKFMIRRVSYFFDEHYYDTEMVP